MIWVTWRQSRFEMILGAAVLAAVAVFGVLTGLNALSSYRAAGLPACVASGGAGADCWSNASTFLRQFDSEIGMISWLNFLPLLIGMFLAAPAVLDLESGTHRLVWMQGVTRGRWLAVKIGYGVGIAAAASAGTIALWTWWRGPFDALQGRFDHSAFDFEGIAPIAYAIFAFALCFAAGAVLRRSAPAIGISFVAYLAARVTVETNLRPHFLAPIKETWSTTTANAEALTKFGAGNWILSEGLIDSTGQSIDKGGPAMSACINPAIGADKAAVNACFQQHGLLNSIVYQPASRFWLFQGIESAIFLGLAVMLLLVAVWWVQRRIV